MAVTNDKVGEFLEGIKRNRRILVSPEGIPLDIQVASRGERVTAFVLDMLFMGIVIILLYLLLVFLFFSNINFSVAMTVILFLAFIVRNCYFLHFELAWQGRTPGKRICGLRVINCGGGGLTPAAIIARNLTREVEVFLPLSVFFSLGSSANPWQDGMLLGWALVLTSLPIFNRDRLRAGDLIGGTMVILMPRRILMADLAERAPQTAEHVNAISDKGTIVQTSLSENESYSFTHEQLAIYGAFELQVLEEILRRPHNEEVHKLLGEVCRKICNKIGWEHEIADNEAQRFLIDFYTAERADLERGQLFGRLREDKSHNSEQATERKD